MKDLMKRTDRPAIRDTLVLFGELAVFAGAGIALWSTGRSAWLWLALGRAVRLRDGFALWEALR